MILTCTLDHVPGIKQFRVVQEDLESLVVTVARGAGFGADTTQLVEKELREILGGDIGLKCHVADRIPREASGKVRAVISRLS